MSSDSELTAGGDPDATLTIEHTDEENAVASGEGYQVGAMIGLRYRVIRFLGSGGNSAAYLALDLAIGSKVAIKVVLPRARMEADTLRRVRAEVALAHKVTHRNVCRTFDLEEANGQPLIKMEYVAGDTLADRLAAGPLSMAEALDVTAQIARGLEAAHACGVVHCDLKPDNVMIETDTKRVVLMDFGVSRATASAEGRRRGGTPAYMAPEAWSDKPIDGRADLYALGCVVYELVTGGRPFHASTPAEWSHQHLSVVPPDLRAVCAAAPRRLVRLVRDLLEKDPARRPRDARAVLQRLARPRRAPLGAGIAIAVVAAAVAAAFAIPDSPAWTPQIRAVGAVYGDNGDSLALSHDGTWIAYDSDRDGSWRVWIEPLAGGEARPVTSADWVSQQPRFTSDDRALLVEHVDRIRTMKTVQFLPRVERVPLDGGPPTLVAEGAATADDCGGTIVVGYDSAAGKPARIVAHHRNGERVLGEIGGIAEISHLRCGRDGRSFVFAATATSIRGKGWQVLLGSLDGAPLRQLTHDDSARRPSLHPDGRSVYYVSDHRGIDSIWELYLDGGAPRIVLNSGVAQTNPIATHDGRALLYTTQVSSIPIMRLDLVTGAVAKLVRPVDVVFQAAVACHGQLVVSGTQTMSFARWRAVLIDPASRGERDVGEATAVAVTRDGEQIVYATPERDGTSRIHALACTGGAPRMIASLPGIAVRIAVEHGVVHLSLVGNRIIAWRVPLTGGAPVAEGDPPLQHVIPAPVGETMLAVTDGRLRLIEPGHPPDDPGATQFDGETASWSADGASFYYWDGHAIQRHDLKSGRDHPVYKSSAFVGALAPSPDGRALYFSVLEGYGQRQLVTNLGDRPRA